ncbi:hypothetical protein CR105_24750 [Massilia eurypsychrophila]|uniref:Uncharacterized protein n=1 Tax=Massilia eurypsychrophila TaxID=1485217 RepID=A0A2G8T8L4_9BURK|nr:hypothetical protein CR105_24750 [Massilia eurypsychrophila]
MIKCRKAVKGNYILADLAKIRGGANGLPPFSVGDMARFSLASRFRLRFLFLAFSKMLFEFGDVLFKVLDPLLVFRKLL